MVIQIPRGLLYFGAEASVKRESGQVLRWHGAGDDRDMTPTFSAHETEGEFSFMTFSSFQVWSMRTSKYYLRCYASF